MKDKKVYYFSHDFNAKYDDKILSLRMEFGWEGYGIFWAIIEDLAQAKDYRLHNSVITKLSFSYNIDINRLKEIYNLCIKEKLFIEENDFFYSNSLTQRMNILDENIRKKSEAGKKGMEKRWKNKENNNSVITELKQSYNNDITLNEIKGNKINKSKIEEVKENNLIICESVYETYLKNFSKKGNKKKSFDYIERIILKKKYEITDFQRILKNYFLEHEKQYPSESDFLKYAKEPQNFFSESNGYWEQFDVKE